MWAVAVEEAVVATEEALGVAEEAAEGAEVVASTAEAGEAIEAGVRAAEDAVVDAEAGIKGLLAKMSSALSKVNKMVIDYMVIDTVLKLSEGLLKKASSSGSGKEKAKAKALLAKLSKLIVIQKECADIVVAINHWFTDNENTEVTLAGFQLFLTAIVVSFLPKLSAVSTFSKI